MKMILAMGILACAIATTIHAESCVVKMEFDRHELTYRLTLQAGSSAVGFDGRAFRPKTVFGPAGARAFFRGDAGREIKCVSNGYCSLDMDSGDPRKKPEIEKLNTGEKFVSGWYSVRDLLRGVNLVLSSSHANSEVRKIQVTFSVLVNEGARDRIALTESDWVELTPEEWKGLLER